ncbi:MAG TPA: hypothetical protein VKW77_02450, partial [Acidimicrobiales bacterium]|nr:hypothetical protein [Acidimicrobiales bacterium]
MLTAGVAVSLPMVPGASSAPSAPSASKASAAGGTYAYYYLWWDTAHWHTSLGPSYPFGQSPLPLPASIPASGCNPASLYPGNVETDVPATLFTQDDPNQIAYDVDSAIAAGLSGFAVDWKGTGSPSQSPSSDAEDQRLDMLVRAVDAAQAAGHDFHLWLSYEASATLLSQSAIQGDLSYLSSAYGSDPAFDRSNGGKPTFVWVGSYKYPLSTVAAVSSAYRPAWFFVGGYQWNEWNNSVAPYFDGDSPYWSSQDPWSNPQSFSQLDGLAATLHSEGKKYFAPLSPGFDDQLNGSSGCVPRDDGATLRALFSGNSSGDPDGWMLISWNEITEGTYVTPELQRYGGAYGGPNGYVHQLLGSVVEGHATACNSSADQPGPGVFAAVAATPGPGGCAGYWMVDAAGEVRSFGGAPVLGSLPVRPSAPIRSVVSTPDGGGYWLLGADGGVFAFGDAGFFGSTGALRLNAPVVGMAATSDGRGYWLVAADGGVFSFGDALRRLDRGPAAERARRRDGGRLRHRRLLARRGGRRRVRLRCSVRGVDGWRPPRPARRRGHVRSRRPRLPDGRLRRWRLLLRGAVLRVSRRSADHRAGCLDGALARRRRLLPDRVRRRPLCLRRRPLPRESPHRLTTRARPGTEDLDGPRWRGRPPPGRHPAGLCRGSDALESAPVEEGLQPDRGVRGELVLSGRRGRALGGLEDGRQRPPVARADEEELRATEHVVDGLGDGRRVGERLVPAEAPLAGRRVPRPAASGGRLDRLAGDLAVLADGEQPLHLRPVVGSGHHRCV